MTYDIEEYFEKDRTFELARQEGVEFRSVLLEFRSDGRLRVSAQDIGPTAERTYGDRELESWVDVPIGALAQLLAALIQDKYGCSLEAVDEFRALCEAHQVPHEFRVW